MWARKRLDIGWSDLAFGVVRCLLPADRARLERGVEETWDRADDSLVCLSVRSGFDLLLGSVDFPAGSEVLISALTIWDMPKIMEEHGLVPVPVDLEVGSLGPSVESLRRAITPKSRAIVVAHLCGGRVPLEPILAAAREHNLLVIEDCAQAFDGGRFLGHREADVSMFSFGTIKTATALGGGVLRVRDLALLERIKARQAAYPVQCRGLYLRRLLKYTTLKFLSSRLMLELIVRGCGAIRFDHDRLINGAVRGFAGPDFFARIRRQPCGPLLALMKRRLCTYDDRRLVRRRSSGELLVHLLAEHAVCPGTGTADHNYWVFPIVVENPQRVIDALRRAGFDTTQGQSMCAVFPPRDRDELIPITARNILRQLVYLPIYPEMPLRALRKMAEVVRREAEFPAFLAGEAAANRPTASSACTS